MSNIFRKTLARELIQYIRRLWPYGIALGVMSAVACIVVQTDRNPVEATGTITAIGFFVIAALAFVVRGLVHTYISFYKSLSTDKIDSSASLVSFLWVQILAYVIFILLTALFILGGVSAFAWKSVGQMFSAFATDWPYFLEFLLYLIIITATIYIIPITWFTAFRLGKQKTLSLIIGIVTLFLCFGTIVIEILLLIHSPSTDMPLAWATILTLFAVFIIVDIVMFLLTYRTLKIIFNKKQDDNN